jgi:DNA-binding HxlR family transcriptional regulator
MMNRKESSTNFLNEQEILNNCPITTFFHQLSGRWKLTILWQLREEGQRFSDLKEALPAISDRILSLQLRGLQEDDFVVKSFLNGSTNANVYRLSTKGASLLPILNGIYAWGVENSIPQK